MGPPAAGAWTSRWELLDEGEVETEAERGEEGEERKLKLEKNVMKNEDEGQRKWRTVVGVLTFASFNSYPGAGR